MNLVKGGYVVKDFGENPEYLLIGTGSEMHLAYGVAEKLFEQGYDKIIHYIIFEWRFLYDRSRCHYQMP